MRWGRSNSEAEASVSTEGVRGNNSSDDDGEVKKQIVSFASPPESPPESPSSSSVSSLSDALRKCFGGRWGEEEKRALERVQNATFRGAAIGFVLRGGYVSFTSALSLVLKSRKRKSLDGVDAKKHSNRNALSVLRWTAFLGSLGGSYVALDETLMRLVGKSKSKKWRGLVSGTVAGSSIALLGKKDPQYAMSIYVLLRAIWLFLRRSRRSGSRVLRTISAPLEMPNADVLVMCLACTQILYAWLMQPRTLPLTYSKFLDKHCGKPEWMIQSFREIIHHNTDSSSIKYQSWHRLIPPEANHLKRCGTPYGLVMQGRYQLWHHILFFLTEYKRKIPVYVPVYFLPALLVHRQKLFTKPKLLKSVLYKSVAGTMQSAFFLTAFCTMAWTSTCGFAWACAPVVGKENLNTRWLAFSLFPIGSSVICEKRSRRKELAAYCSARALESFMLCALAWGWIPKKMHWKRFDIALFSLGVGLIMHCYTDSEGDYRYTFRSKYLNVIDFVFGNTGHKLQKIRHVPSTSDLVRPYLMKQRSRSP